MALEFERQQQVASAAPGPMVSPAMVMAAPISPALPPTPPSHDARSPPPPSPRSPHESKLPLSPPPTAPSPRSLPFSIENILRPDFGVTRLPSERPAGIRTPELLLRTPPKTPESVRHDFPVDLSQKTSGCPTDLQNAKANQLCGANKYPDNPEVLANPKVPVEDNNKWPAWVYCTRYSDRPSSGPRSRRIKRRERNPEEKRPRTAFTSEQLARLKKEFEENKYLTEKRRQDLARDLGLNESQIKIWFQNKRAKIKKATGSKPSSLAAHLMAQGLYNHSTIPVDEDDPCLS